MTRLITEWIEEIGDVNDPYGAELKQKTGLDYDGLLIKTCHITQEYLASVREKLQVCIIPITTGQGVIGSFAQSVAGIIQNMGFAAIVTEKTDVAGIYEAGMKGADILFMADDERYIAINLRNGKISNNDQATARGFVTILNQMTRNMNCRDTLVLGGGTVGKIIIDLLKLQQDNVFVYDKDKEILNSLAGAKVTPVEKDEIRNYKKIIDATCEGGWITKDMLNSQAKIAALGVPFSFSEDAGTAFEQQALYDCLTTGTAVMLGEVI